MQSGFDFPADHGHTSGQPTPWSRFATVRLRQRVTSGLDSVETGWNHWSTNKRAIRMSRASLAILLTLLGGGCHTREQKPGGGQDVVGLFGSDQVSCERSLESKDGVAVRPVAARLSPRWHLQPAESLANIHGVDWDPTSNTLAVLDVRLGQVSVMDTVGSVQQQFGRFGRGPGEFNFLPLWAFTTNRLAVFPEGFAVADVQSIYWYGRNGRYQSTLRKYRTPLVGTHDVHLAHLDGALVASESGKGDLSSNDRDIRTALSVEAIVPNRPGSWRGALALRNGWVHLEEIVGYPEQRPYMNSHRRTWDANGAFLVALSYDRFGLCFFDASSLPVASYALDLQPDRVDAAERERELRRHVRDPDASQPFIGVSQRQRFEGKWPKHTPFYLDVVLGSDSIAWAMRRSAGSAIADLYHLRTGYRGSFRLPDGRLPAIVRSNIAWFIVTDSLGIDTFRAVDVPLSLTSLERGP